MQDSPPLILLVEDEEDIRDAVSTLLELDGYRVLTCAHGQEALEMLGRCERPRLVLLDLMMPVMGGEQFLQFLHREGWLEHLPVVVLSGSPFLPPGAREYLRKPVAVDHLLSVVRRYCGDTPARARAT